MRLGIMGGTFDPVHLGHLIIAEEARLRVGLDRVLFVPAGRPWLKAGGPKASAQDRLAMVRLAIKGNPFFDCTAIEVNRQGNSYTAVTLEELRAALGLDTELFFIVGLDSLADFHRWQRPDRILKLATLVVLVRPGYDRSSLRVLDKVKDGASQSAVLLEGPLIEISSTEIRRRVAQGASIRYLVPPEVERYIMAHGLYRSEEKAT